ncbi:hypothetical protein MmiAt1_06290 [Methanimicrococcus sp. At1]|uniref:Uncharacterized protein n=1 Tax=Methanimicrococcus hacksteinii TaxID=3028293 RepID=A0ABU3VNT8_9EURY|nr:hypothetical protein [Methanimicrococcus sp. At1]MDV0445073.1 hypothetical protein [Methanimicrococcus sp. At1]
MSGRNAKKKTDAKKANVKPVDSEKKKLKRGGKNLSAGLSKDLRKKIGAEKDPEAVVEKALAEYYSEKPPRYENTVQKEIDNNIMEIQRRHISDLKGQLETSNKNYEELMKTYQAYMLQVQPLAEAAQIQKTAEPELLAAKYEEKEEELKEKEALLNEKETAVQNKQEAVRNKENEMQNKQKELQSKQEEIQKHETEILKQKEELEKKAKELQKKEEEMHKQSAPASSEISSSKTNENTKENAKKWYEFWK